MKRGWKIFIIIICVFVLMLAGLTLFSRVYYKRSLRATLAEFYLRLTIKHYSAEEMEKWLVERKKQPEIPYVLPEKIKIEGGLKKKEFEGMQVFYLNGEGKGERVLYLHGGSYLHEPDPHHFSFLNDLIRKSDARVLFPVYPKAPWHDFSRSYTLLSKFYEEESKEEGLILMGDSAGGGLALGLAQYFHEINLRKPNGVIVFSPWLDLTMSNPEIEAYEKIDPWLRRLPTNPIPRVWANGTDLKDYRISPTFGTLDGLNHVSIFVGTREILYPDIVKFADKLKEKDISYELFIGEGLNHVYPLFPIPEGWEAVETVAERMKEIKKMLK